jgi:hypothetical protein
MLLFVPSSFTRLEQYQQVHRRQAGTSFLDELCYSVFVVSVLILSSMLIGVTSTSDPSGVVHIENHLYSISECGFDPEAALPGLQTKKRHCL